MVFDIFIRRTLFIIADLFSVITLAYLFYCQGIQAEKSTIKKNKINVAIHSRENAKFNTVNLNDFLIRTTIQKSEEEELGEDNKL